MLAPNARHVRGSRHLAVPATLRDEDHRDQEANDQEDRSPPLTLVHVSPRAAVARPSSAQQQACFAGRRPPAPQKPLCKSKRPKVEEQLSLPRKFDAPVACDPPPERFGGMATSLSDVLGTEYCEVRCHEWRDPALYFMWRRRYSPLATFARGLPQAISSPYRSSLTFPGHLQAPRRRHIRQAVGAQQFPASLPHSGSA